MTRKTDSIKLVKPGAIKSKDFSEIIFHHIDKYIESIADAIDGIWCYVDIDIKYKPILGDPTRIGGKVMSYDISIIDENGDTMLCATPHLLSGGTVQCDKNMKQIEVREAEINITYNYCSQYKQVWDTGSMYIFEGKKAKDIIPTLTRTINILGTQTDDDYWKSTPGNAGQAVKDLLYLCQQCPDGTIVIS